MKIKDIIISKKKGRSKIVVRNGKGHKEGDKPKNAVLSEDLVEKVQKWIEDKKLEEDALLFTNRLGNPYSTGRSLNKTLDHYCTKVGIDKTITNHSFRHMFCTETYRKCGNMQTTQQLMRHKSSRTTELYNHQLFEDS